MLCRVKTFALSRRSRVIPLPSAGTCVCTCMCVRMCIFVYVHACMCPCCNSGASFVVWCCPFLVCSVAVHPRKPVVATVSDDRTWKLWSIPNGDHWNTRQLRSDTFLLCCFFSFSLLPHTFAIALVGFAECSCASLLRLVSGELIMSGDGHKDFLTSCDFHPSGQFLSTASGDSTVKLWDFKKAKCVGTYTDHTQVDVHQFCFCFALFFAFAVPMLSYSLAGGVGCCIP